MRLFLDSEHKSGVTLRATGVTVIKNKDNKQVVCLEINNIFVNQK